MTAEPLRPRIELNVDGIPAELKALRHWVAYRLLPPKKPGGKPRKVPVDPRTGGNASSTDPKSWGTFEEAIAAMRRYSLAGIGFCFEGSGYVGIDLDGCCDPESGVLSDDAQAIVKQFETYTEYSPTGTGLHLLAKGTLSGRGRKRGWIEIYCEGRFFTMTGVVPPDSRGTIADAQPQIDQFYDSLGRKDKSKQERREEVAKDLDEEQVIERAMRAKNSAKFMRLWTGDTTGYASASEADLALCCILAFWTGKNAELMDRLFRRSGLMRDKWDERHGADTYGGMTLGAAIESTRDVYDPFNRPSYRPGDTDEGERPQIVLNGALGPELFEASQAVLLRAHPPVVFQRDTLLVRVARVLDYNADGIKRKGNALFITPLDPTMLVLLLTELADWVRIEKGKIFKVDCPTKVAATLLAASGHWRLPPLLGVVEAPTLRSDGSVIDVPGYDPATALYAEFGGMPFAPLLEKPTPEHAKAELEFILSFIAKFPFVAESDRSAVVAAILTALIRRMLPTAPMFAFRATTMSAGKTLLADVISIIATGRPCALLTQGKDETEDQKRMLALLIAGDLVVNIDNVERPLGGADICAVLTGGMYQSRLLGASKIVKVPTRTLFVATGNNMVIEGDLISRVVVSDLDPRVERAELREFEGDLREEILQNRALLIRAGLTILRAYRIAGRPKITMPAFGRFERWSQEVRAPLMWLGMPDPLLGVERLRDQDPVTSRLRALLYAWRDTLGEEPYTVAGVVKRAKEEASTLCDAIEEAIGSAVAKQAFGIYLRRYANRVVDGLRIVRYDASRGVARWRVEELLRGTCGTSHTQEERDENQGGKGFNDESWAASTGVENVPQVPRPEPCSTDDPLTGRTERRFAESDLREVGPPSPLAPPCSVTSRARGEQGGEAARGRRCFLCSGTRFWRLRGGTSEICGSCNAPMVAAEEVVWLSDPPPGADQVPSPLECDTAPEAP